MITLKSSNIHTDIHANTIAVVIPTKNGHNTISDALVSILHQTYKDVLICIVLDHLNHEQAVITELSTIIQNTLDKQVNYAILIGESRGPGRARDLAIRWIADTYPEITYTACLDDDDIWHDTNKLQKQIHFLNQNENIKITSVEYTDIINERGVKIGSIHQPVTPEECTKQMLLRNPIMTSGVMFYTKCYIDAGGFSDAYLAEDYELWLKMNMNQRNIICNTPDTAITYRHRSLGLSRSRSIEMAKRVLDLTYKYRRNYPHGTLALIKSYLRLFKSVI